MSRLQGVMVVCMMMLLAGTASGQTPNETASGGTQGNGFQHRKTETRELLLKSGGGNEETERAVAAAINWLARHQNGDGSWGCVSCLGNCKDASCKTDSDKRSFEDYPVAATAFGLLPFLAAGQTHVNKGPYQAVIGKGLDFLVRQQDKRTGQFGKGSMYEQALGTMTLCEAYGVSQDQTLKDRAQEAVAFLEDAQNEATGGWHYVPNPRTVGDLSVTGWQIMALKSGQLAGLKVNPQTFAKANRFLTSVSKGTSNGLGSYMPESSPTPAMSAVGLLCKQSLGLKRKDPAQVEGIAYLIKGIAHAERNCYFEYYATQAMHNLPGEDWQQWNDTIHKRLVKEQVKEGCAVGSWSPGNKGHVAGRLMSTSLSALTLEVYYRYPPFYELEKPVQ